MDASQLFQQAFALHQQGQADAARALYQRVLELQPNHADALHLLGLIEFEQGRAQSATALIHKAIASNSNNFVFQLNLGNILSESGDLAGATAAYEAAIRLNPGSVDGLFRFALVLIKYKQFERAIANLERARLLNPKIAAIYNELGVAHQGLDQLERARQNYEKCLALSPRDAKAHHNLGVVAQKLGRFTEARRLFQKALALQPDLLEAHMALAQLFIEHRQPQSAIETYLRVATLTPTNAEIYLRIANQFFQMRNYVSAIENYRIAANLDPACVGAYFDMGLAYRHCGNHDRAIEAFQKAYALAPETPFLLGIYLITRLQLNRWDDVEGDIGRMRARILQQQIPSEPFPVLSMDESGQENRLLTEASAKQKFTCTTEMLPPPKAGKRIKIGYFSADFNDHATMHLIAEVFERHDRGQFELFAFSFGPSAQDPWKARAKQAFDHFIEVDHLSDIDIAMLSRQKGIAIAVDLKGYTHGGRTQIFAHRAAPVQVNYLGYPGTMGLQHMDYIVADRFLVPTACQAFYTESVVQLPHCYQPNDSRQTVSTRQFSRADAGLPPEGFVFCSFNNNYKILPFMFDIWMRLLGRVENSVLWIYCESPIAHHNLQREAARRGIAAERIVLAQRVLREDHLSRMPLADLFLDTFPCNAHTTASDALRVGLPLITCSGETFASRVAGSLLHTLDMPELIVESLPAYEALALELALQPAMLQAIRQKLRQNLTGSPLFDTRRYTRNLETAYVKMYERARQGLPPEAFLVHENEGDS